MERTERNKPPHPKSKRMETTINEVIKGKHIPNFSFIKHKEKNIIFGDFKDENSDVIRVTVTGDTPRGLFSLACYISLPFIKDVGLDYAVLQWEHALKKETSSPKI
jgi:hypothetical protein